MLKVVVELDLAGYSDVARELEENLGVEVVAHFNEQIQNFVEIGLEAVGTSREQVVMATTGDGAILTFETAEQAHHFARALHEATERHNASLTKASAQRWFRIGAATGEIVQRFRPGGGYEIAGITIANAVRYESASRVGQLVVDRKTFQALPTDLQALYAPEEEIRGKRQERFHVRRFSAISESDNDAKTPTIPGILNLFDQLNPRDQLHRLILLIRMPVDHRPSDLHSIFNRQDIILDWSSSSVDKLRALEEGLKYLLEKQENPPLAHL